MPRNPGPLNAAGADPMDVAVLGGGPAGSIAALLLARWGYRVALLTRPDPQRRLAETIPPSCTRLFQRLGLHAALQRAGRPSTGHTAWWADGTRQVEPYQGSVPGYQVLRGHLDPLLLDQAEAAGTRVLRRSTARAVSGMTAGATRLVRFDADGTPATIRARWVLDCTGRAGLIARQGYRHVERRVRTTALVAVWEHPAGWELPDPSHTLVESHAEGWVWSVPVTRTQRYVTVMVDPTVTPVRGHHLDAVYARELAKTAHVGPLLADARQRGHAWARDASPYWATEVGEPGLLLVGDAASFGDPLSAFGVKKAAATAWLAAVVVRTALADPSLLSAALELYRRQEHAFVERLHQESITFARRAADAHREAFWTRRAEASDTAPAWDRDVTALKQDPKVLAAFQELKARPAIQLRPAADLRRELRAIVHQDRIALAPHLVTPAFPEGIRFLRDVDLDRLVTLAPTATQVPDLFDAYNRHAPPVALPDFLGALSVLIGKRILELA